MSSTSARGATSITLQFSLDRDIDAAAQDVQAAIAAAQRKLPPDMPTPPSYRKVNPADMPIFYIAMLSPTLPLHGGQRIRGNQLAQRISTIPGWPRCSSTAPRNSPCASTPTRTGWPPAASVWTS
jgi:HAE1 family hydrophobic/amphiphilic exporter-1